MLSCSCCMRLLNSSWSAGNAPGENTKATEVLPVRPSNSVHPLGAKWKTGPSVLGRQSEKQNKSLMFFPSRAPGFSVDCQENSLSRSPVLSPFSLTSQCSHSLCHLLKWFTSVVSVWHTDGLGVLTNSPAPVTLGRSVFSKVGTGRGLGKDFYHQLIYRQHSH